MSVRIRRALAFVLPLLATAAFAPPAAAQQGLVLDGFGGVHAFNGAANINPKTPYFGFDVAEAIQILPGGQGFYVLDAFGGLHKGGNAPAPTATPYFGFDIARDLALVPTGSLSTIVASPGSLANSDGNSSVFVQVFGTSFSGAAIAAGNMFPVACKAANLLVTARTAAGAPRLMMGTETVTLTLLVNEVDSAIGCTIAAGVSQCSDTSQITIPPGTRVAYRIDYGNLNTTANGSFYVHRGFTCG